MKILLSKTLLMMLAVVFMTSTGIAQDWIPSGTNLSLNTNYENVTIGDLSDVAGTQYLLRVGTDNPSLGGIISASDNSQSAITGLGLANGPGVEGLSISGNGVYGSSVSGHAGYFDGKVQFDGTLRGNQLGGSLRIQTDHGYLDIGPKNSNWSHFVTDRSKFYFNKEVRVNSNVGNYLNGKIGSHKGDLLLRTEGINRMIIKRSNGFVGIGTTNPTDNLHIEGTLYVSGTQMPSDLRLKKDIKEFQYGLKEVMALQPFTYDYNGKGGTQSGRFNVGIIAQELQEIAPEFISEFVHEVVETTEEVNGAGEVEYRTEVVGEETYLKIYDTGIKYMLMNAIKEQQTIIEDQQTQLDELKEIVSNLAKGEINQQEIILEGAQGYLEQNQPNPN